MDRHVKRFSRSTAPAECRGLGPEFSGRFEAVVSVRQATIDRDASPVHWECKQPPPGIGARGRGGSVAGGTALRRGGRLRRLWPRGGGGGE
ncbi:hypothetical protein GCM10017653_16180 [Ancylobacter defluvii]|uniref:Uncharacterized protein n=1 Tax=Ancylobacter defluvii TaxID=1282440 RepID=A0A9W6JWG3_9HYPH|nr:hypothetical protein GCM10017653_16180 [Ancylobacter defluvii]